MCSRSPPPQVQTNSAFAMLEEIAGILEGKRLSPEIREVLLQGLRLASEYRGECRVVCFKFEV